MSPGSTVTTAPAPVVSVNRPGHPKMHTVGPVLKDVEIRIAADGEILVRGPLLMNGYWHREDETRATIVDGWLHTGDVGTMDEGGNLVITDRLKDMYVSGGFNAYPAEIEAYLRGFGGIEQVAVVGLPDERMGEVGWAFVVRSPGDERSDEEFSAELRAWAKAEMANYKVPRVIEFRTELPKTPVGKILRRELRQPA